MNLPSRMCVLRILCVLYNELILNLRSTRERKQHICLSDSNMHFNMMTSTCMHLIIDDLISFFFVAT